MWEKVFPRTWGGLRALTSLPWAPSPVAPAPPSLTSASPLARSDSVCASGKEGGDRSGSRLSCGIRSGGESQARTFLPRERESSGERREESPLTFPPSLPPPQPPPPAGWAHTRPSLSLPPAPNDPYIPGRLLASWSLENRPHFKLKGHQSESVLCPEHVCVWGGG